MSFSNLSINGFQPSWGESVLSVNSTTIQILALTWDESVEEALGFSFGNKPVMRSRGRYEPSECSFTVYMRDAQLMEAAIGALSLATSPTAGKQRLSNVVFPIMLNWEYEPSAPTREVSFENCRIIGRGMDIAEGPDLIVKQYRFKPFAIREGDVYL